MPTLSEFIIDRLYQNNVRHMLNVPGDYSLPFCKAVEKSKIKLIGTTCEANAGFAADAYARVNGLSAVSVTYCVGGFNLINSIGGAFAENSPVVVISGSPGIKERSGNVLLHHMVRNFECQHEVFENITCANTVLRDPTKAAYEIDRVIEAAKHYKQPVYIELPRDMANKAISYDPYTVGTPPAPASDPENLKEVLSEVREWINNAKNPIIWAGVEVARHGLGAKITKFAEATNIPIVTDILGKSCINERHPLCYGVYSESTSRDEIIKMVANSDCVIMLGVLMTDMNLGFLPLRCQKRNTINCNTRTMQVRNHTFENVQFSDFVSGLCEINVNKHSAPEALPPSCVNWQAKPDSKITTVRLFEKINSILTENMAVVADVGDSLFGSLDITVHKPNQFLAPAFYTSMGFAVPAALGVQLNDPNVRPVVLVGDGAFQMTGMEFSTLVRLGLNPIVVVLNNNGYGTEKVLMEGEFNNIQNWSFENIPLVVGGGVGAKVTTEGELDAAMQSALASKVPYIMNVVLPENDFTPALTRMFSKLAKKF